MAVIDADLISTIRAKIDTEFGVIPPSLSPAQAALAGLYRDKLARIIASGDRYVVDFAEVDAGIKVVVSEVSPGVYEGETVETGELS